MSMGVPVIASNVGGLTEVLENEVSGLHVPNEPHSAAAAMKRIREDPDLTNRLIGGAKHRVCSRFSAEQMIQSTLQSYERTLASRLGSPNN